MAALLYGFAGVIFVPVILLISTVTSAISSQPGRTGIAALSAGVLVLLPLIYAALGFVFGVLAATVYNLAAKIAGGIEVEVG